MARPSVLVYGAGGHGRVAADIIERQGKRAFIGFLDDRPGIWGQMISATYPVIGGIDILAHGLLSKCEVIVAVGDNTQRRHLCTHIAELGYTFGCAVHPSAQIGRDVQIGPGTVVMPNVVINTGAKIGAHVIINTAATVDHDCVIGDYSHIAPGVHLAGCVIVGESVQVSVGASAVPGVHIGDRSTIGAGAVVIGNIPSDVTAVGIPATVVNVHSHPLARRTQ